MIAKFSSVVFYVFNYDSKNLKILLNRESFALIKNVKGGELLTQQHTRVMLVLLVHAGVMYV